ncbi:MAG: IS200/IS605 family transposase [Deltaproteobacteria bacterium]|nr:IS200/IS605 family transposase [Deltaproteobacteria bacterium]MBI3390602.1 IS200/IS605 family transposase [Deltaproteobacteria bacterium]
MRRSFTQLWVHCVWATWDRTPLLVSDGERAVYVAIPAKCDDLGCEPLAIGGIADHVHLVVRIPATLAVARLMKEVKGASSHLVTHQISSGDFFKWHGSYGALTVGKDSVNAVKAYIERQEEHHNAVTIVADWEQCGTNEE